MGLRIVQHEQFERARREHAAVIERARRLQAELRQVMAESLVTLLQSRARRQPRADLAEQAARVERAEQVKRNRETVVRTPGEGERRMNNE